MSLRLWIVAAARELDPAFETRANVMKAIQGPCDVELSLALAGMQ